MKPQAGTVERCSVLFLLGNKLHVEDVCPNHIVHSQQCSKCYSLGCRVLVTLYPARTTGEVTWH